MLWIIYQGTCITAKLSFLTFLQQLAHIRFYRSEMKERNVRVRVSVKLSPLQPENIFEKMEENISGISFYVSFHHKPANIFRKCFFFSLLSKHQKHIIYYK